MRNGCAKLFFRLHQTLFLLGEQGLGAMAEELENSILYTEGWILQARAGQDDPARLACCKA
jgi:hypothetical protein